MKLQEFVADFADLFDETDASSITPNCEFHELEEWSSIIAMAIIAMVRTHYGKTITGKEIRNCETVEDLFNLLNNE